MTKFAPADHVGEHMSVYTSLTGVRGILTAFMAFPLILWIGLLGVGMIGATLIPISSACLR